jgi:hypothetical protein
VRYQKRGGVRVRETFTTTKALAEKLEKLENKLAGRLDAHEEVIAFVLGELRKLMEPSEIPEPKRRPIGFGKGDD